jgi:hypothetical protein
VRRFAVFVATTDGPVQIQRISRERAPLSMVILGSGSERLPVSDRYDDFAHPGSGPVERFFGPFPEGGFRLEVSGAIDGGDSWQLGVFLAHAVQSGDGFILVRGDPAVENGVDHIIWLTGQVDYDGKVSGIGHVQEKLYASRDTLTTWLDSGVPVSLVVPAGDNHQRLLACELPESASVIAADDAIGLCHEFGIDPKDSMTPTKRPVETAPSQALRLSGRVLLALGIILVAAFVVTLAVIGKLGEVRTWPERLTTLIVNQADHPPQKAPPPKPLPQQRATPTPKLTQQSPPTEQAVSVSVHERRAPAGAACPAVHFGGVLAVERPVKTDPTGQPIASHAAELCGLLLIIDAGPKPLYLRAKVTLRQGLLIDADRPPKALSGYHLVSGPQRWVLVLPYRKYGPVRFGVAVQASEIAPIASAGKVDLNSTILEHAILTD